MKVKNIIKRATSAIAALALGVTSLTSTLASAEAVNPNPTHTAENINFSYTEGYIKYDAHAGYPFPNGTNDERMWIIKLNNQTYGNLCIHAGTTINSGSTPYYSYQATSTGEANSDYWENQLSDGQRYTVGLLMYYGYPNGIENMSSSLGATSGAAMDATQMLVWEATQGTRVLPDDYSIRTDYSSYTHMQYHYTDGAKDYQYTPLRDLYYKLNASHTVDVQLTADGKAYYNYLVNKIANHKALPSVAYNTETKAKQNATTLKFNKSTKRYEATITTNEALFEDFNARTAIGNLGVNVVKQGNTAANGDATYLLHTAKYFSGTKVTEKMIKQSTQPHANRTPYGTGLQVWAQKVTSTTNPQDTSVQQTVTGSQADPVSAFLAINAEEARGDFTVVKKSVSSTGVEDAALAESVRTDAKFMVFDTTAERYIKTSIDAQGNYVYVSSTGYSNTSTDAGTIFKLDANGKFKITNLPLGRKYKVVEFETATQYTIPEGTVEVTLSEQNISQTTTQLNQEKSKLYVSKKVIAEADDTKHINGAELAGAKMAIVAEDGTTFAEWTSDGKEHLVEDIPEGKYTLKELAAPDGYQIATDIEFTVGKNNVVTADSVTVQSKDDIPLIVMSDAVTKTEISKINAATSKELAGAELTLYDWNDKEVEKWTSTDKAHVIYGLVVGKTYRLSESLAPIGFATTTDITFTVESVDDNGKPIVTKAVMIDEVARGTLKVKKRSEGNTQIANINYILEGQADAGFDFKVEKRTDENGEIVFEKIPVGTYTITEDGSTVPAAYLVAEPQKVTIQYAQTTEATFYNKLKKGSIKLSKRTEGDLNVSNIKFTLKGTADCGAYVERTATTDDKGVAYFNDIYVGTYEVIEDCETVPTAYLVADSVSVKVEYAKTTDVEVFNEQKTGSIQLTKRTSDNNGNAVANIKFTLSGKADSGVDVNISAVTDASGKATFENVPIGTYEITEDGTTVPTGYLVADKQSVKVEYAKTSNVTFVNERTPDTPPDTPPQTGYHENNPMLVVLLIGIAAIGAMTLIARRNKEKD